MTSPVTFLSFNCLALSSFPTFTLDRAATLPAGFFTISTSCCNDSGDPGFWATCKLEFVRNCETHHDERQCYTKWMKITFAKASTRLWSSEITLDSSMTKVCKREIANSVAVSAHSCYWSVNYSTQYQLCKMKFLIHTIPAPINKLCHVNIVLCKV